MKVQLLIILYISLILHEMGHYLAAKMTNAPIISFKLGLFGLNMQINTDNLISEEKIFLYYAGPLINLLLVIYASITKVSAILQVNLLLLFLNLIPIVPLDGGNILKTILNKYLNKTLTYIIIILVNIFFTGITVLCFLQSNNIIFLAIFIFCIKGIINEKKIRDYEKFRKQYNKHYYR